jgi:hypothetical protein
MHVERKGLKVALSSRASFALALLFTVTGAFVFIKTDGRTKHFD